ncbi:MAG: YbhB/YbcL family Raf kinase inhibitor-like protein [Anaerolineales bacterium]|nr:YbhB/YbcL family Raf kinase inhibitor-like protein [Anaerolineales bacterium]
MDFTLTSSVFVYGEPIPAKYTCDGEGISPPLSWQGVPETAKSLVLIVDDPDAPIGTWVHWVLYNLPASTGSLEENISAVDAPVPGACHGKNSWRRLGYGGPCPPGGTHRYFFKLFALDIVLALQPGAKKKDVDASMTGHVLAEAQLMGTYRRSRS